MTRLDGFLRHIRACNNAVLPGDRLAFRLGPDQVGWVPARHAAALAELGCRVGQAVVLDAPDALPGLARAAAARGLCRWRDEAFDVRADPDGPVLSRIDRGALPLFGIQAAGVHLNGLVRGRDGLYLWVARRAADKQLDPGKLDHLVAGGVPAGLTPLATLVKEAAEEAAMPAELAATARPVAVLAYAMERAEGLRRDRLYCYDLDLPDSFIPQAADGEVESFELWPIGRVMDAVRDTDAFKFNVSLVLIDLFQRLGLVSGPAPSSAAAAR